ncbi:MAG: VOC family protein [Terrimicrobiaceae bacterium]
MPMPAHVAFRVDLTKEEILERLKAKGVQARYEPRGPGFFIVSFDDPDGNLVEIFPNVETMDLPPGAFCPAEHLDHVMAELAAQAGTFASTDEQGQTIYPLVPREPGLL